MLYYASLLLYFNFSFLKNQIRSYNPLPNIMNVVNYGLKVRCSVVRSRDEDVIIHSSCCGGVEW